MIDILLMGLACVILIATLTIIVKAWRIAWWLFSILWLGFIGLIFLLLLI